MTTATYIRYLTKLVYETLQFLWFVYETSGWRIVLCTKRHAPHIFNILTRLTIKKSNEISLNIKRLIPTEQIHTRTNRHLVSSLLLCNGLLLFVQTRKIRFIGDGIVFRASAPFFQITAAKFCRRHRRLVIAVRYTMILYAKLLCK